MKMKYIIPLLIALVLAQMSATVVHAENSAVREFYVGGAWMGVVIGDRMNNPEKDGAF